MSNYKINGIPVTREEFVNHKPGASLPQRIAVQPEKAGVWTKPKVCETLAWEAEELPKARQLDQALGLGDVEYSSIGAPVFHSPGAYDRYVKAHGFVNKTSGKGNVTLTAEMLDQAIARGENRR